MIHVMIQWREKTRYLAMRSMFIMITVFSCKDSRRRDHELDRLLDTIAETSRKEGQTLIESEYDPLRSNSPKSFK